MSRKVGLTLTSNRDERVCRKVLLKKSTVFVGRMNLTHCLFICHLNDVSIANKQNS